MAHGGLTWEREFSGIRFERMVDVAVSATPNVNLQLKFGLLDRRPVVHGQMQAGVELICQRCMAPMVYQVSEAFDLMVVDAETALSQVPESHEPWLANALRLHVLELVEEQLLLALPLIPKHAEDCIELNDLTGSGVDESLAAPAPKLKPVPEDAEAAELTEVQRPFGNLRELLRKQ